MGILDKLPFSWSGDYTNYYKPKESKSHSYIKITTEPVPRKVEKTPAKINPKEKAEDLLEQIKYQEHRKALQQYAEKLKIREQKIISLEEESIARINYAKENLTLYSNSLYEVEYKIMDYAKRFEKKEQSIFDEVIKNADLFKKLSLTPSEQGFNFEQEFSESLLKNGFVNVRVTQKSNDYGADILAEKDGVTYVIQCKKYSSMVGIEAVQQVFAAKIHYNAHVAVVATNSVFTLAAKTLANETGVLLWDGEKTGLMMSI